MEKNKFTVQVLSKEVVVRENPMTLSEQEDLIYELEMEYDGHVTLQQTVCYVPILTTNGD